MGAWEPPRPSGVLKRSPTGTSHSLYTVMGLAWDERAGQGRVGGAWGALVGKAGVTPQCVTPRNRSITRSRWACLRELGTRGILLAFFRIAAASRSARCPGELHRCTRWWRRQDRGPELVELLAVGLRRVQLGRPVGGLSSAASNCFLFRPMLPCSLYNCVDGRPSTGGEVEGYCSAQ